MFGIRSKGLVLAMEEEGRIDQNEENVEAAELPVEVPAEVEQEVGELQVEEGRIDDLQNAIEDAEEDAATLGEIRDVMAEQLEEAPAPAEGEVPAEGEAPAPAPAEGEAPAPVEGEGIDESAARIAEIAVESICARLGIRSTGFPALESFGSKSSRRIATRRAMEGISDKMMVIFKSVKEAIAQMWEKVMAFLSTLLDSNLRLESSAKAMQAKAEALDKAAKAEGEIENKSIAAAFGGKGVNFDVVARSLASHALFAEAAAKSVDLIVGMVSGIDKHVPALMKGEVPDLQDLGKQGKKLLEDLAVTDFSETEIKDGKVISKIGPFVNNTYIAVSAVVEGDGVGTFDYKIESEKAGEETKVATLNKEQCVNLCKEVLGLVKATAEYKAKMATFKKINDASAKLFDDVLKGIGKVTEAAGGTNMAAELGKVRSKVQKINGVASKFASKLPSANVYAGKIALNYVAASIKAHGVKVEEKAEEKK